MAEVKDEDEFTHFRFRWRKIGAHVHVGVWSGTERKATHGNNGRLIFRENEWEDFVRLLREAAGAGEFSAVELVRDAPAPAGSAHGVPDWRE